MALKWIIFPNVFASPRDLSADIKEMYFIDTNNKGKKIKNPNAQTFSKWKKSTCG